MQPPPVYRGCLNVTHAAKDCPSSGQPMAEWCEPCATRSHLIDEHMNCRGAASPMVRVIVQADITRLYDLHHSAHETRRDDGRGTHEHERNVMLP